MSHQVRIARFSCITQIPYPSASKFILGSRQYTQGALQKSSWTHPVLVRSRIYTNQAIYADPSNGRYTQEQIQSVKIAHRNAKCLPDKLALETVRFLRWGMDFVTGYRANSPLSKPNRMTERKWITRFVFLESVAGVPGMVAGMLRHLKSIRQMKRDYGWIETLLEEAYNERMHLLTFLQLAKPGWKMRTMVLGTQCVFFTAFFMAYILSPRICHRFVGYLEEEAVITYTKAIKDLDDGCLPLWKSLGAPAMAVKYWQMPEGNRCMRSLLLYVRADEAKHRDVNHTLGSLDQDRDRNPFSAKFREQIGKVNDVIDSRVPDELYIRSQQRQRVKE